MTFKYYGPIEPKSPLYQHRRSIDSDGQEISDLSAYIVNASLDASKEGVQRYYTINGSRQSGKTSLLLEIAQNTIEVGGHVCRIDFQNAYGASPERSINFIARQLLRSIPELGASVKVPDEFEHDGYGFDHWLCNLPFPEEKAVVLLFEELGALPLETRQFLGGLLRGAFNERFDTRWNFVTLVFLGGVELSDMITIEVSPLFNICENLPLLDLDLHATQSLIGAGFQNSVSFEATRSNELALGIHAHVLGHPYMTQYLGDKALNHAKKHGEPPSDIQSVLSKLNMDSSEYFSYLCQSIQKYDLVDVVKILFQTGRHPDEKALQRLNLLGALGQRTEYGFPFRNPLIRVVLEKWLFSIQPPVIDNGWFDNPKNVEKETHLARLAKVQHLLEGLFGLPCLETVEDRQHLLVRSGIATDQSLDLKGSSKEAITRLFHYLDHLPRLPNGFHPLGVFLTNVKALSRDEEKTTGLIDGFVTQYGLMESKSTVFVSYAWGGESEHMVDELELAFINQGIGIVRDKKDLGYKGSIKEFEQRIGRGDCVILVISDKYLRSEHCMYELVEIAEHQDIRKRIFPIVLEDARIYKAIDCLGYYNYWIEEVDHLNDAIKQVSDLSNIGRITADLDKYTRIRAKFNDLIALLADMNTLTPDMHKANNFGTLINAIETIQRQIP